MRSTDKRLALCAALILCLLVFIWGNSLMPGAVSQAISNLVQDLLFGGSTPEGAVAPGNGILRKIAHFTEFAALGMSLCWLFGMLQKHWRFAFASGVTAACIDELIQFFVPERACRLYDVGIDALGVLAGIALLTIGHTYLKKRSAP